MSGLITVMARLTLPLEHWPEFWPAIFAMASSPDEGLRESVLEVIEELGDKIFDFMRPYMGDLLAFCDACMAADQNPHVRLAAVKAVGVLLGEVQEDADDLVEKMRPLVPPMLEMANVCVQEGADMEARKILNIFQAMIRLCPNIIAPHVLNIAQFCLITTANLEIDWDVRSDCLAFLEDIIQLRPSFVNRNGLLDPILTIAFNVAAEPQVEGLSSWEITPHRYALQIIDCVARQIKPKYCFDNVMQRIDAWMPSENPWERRAAIGALSAIPNGFVEQLLPNLESLLPYMQSAFADPDHFVRQAGCILLGQFADYLSPDILEYHETCLPLAYQALCDDNQEIQERALYSIMAFMEHLDHTKTEAMLDQLVHRLVFLLEHSNNKEIQEMAIETLSAVAQASLDNFAPYWETVTKMMQQLMEVTQPDLLSLRAYALKCAGVVSMSVGKELFAPYFDYFMNKALESFHLTGVDTTQLREYSINFFGDVAEALEEDFHPYFDTCLQIILESLTNVDGAQPEFNEENRHMAALMVDSDDERDEAAIGRGLPATDLEDAEIDEEDRLPPELEGLKYITNMGLVEEKIVALQALGSIGHAMGASFVPHIPRCLEVLSDTARYVHPKVRNFTVFPLETFATCLNKQLPPERPWVEGQNPEEYPLHPTVQEFVDSMIALFVKRILNDIELSVVSRYIEALKVTLNTLGAPALHHHLPNLIMPALSQAMHMKTVAHGMATEEADDESEVIAQELLAVFDSACDLVTTLAKHYGLAFGNLFPLLEGIITHLTTEEDPDDEATVPWRQEAIGSLAEVCENCTVNAFTPEQVHIFLAQAIKGLKQEQVTVRCNAIYLTRLVSVSPASFDWWAVIIPIIVPLLLSEDDQTADNANGCIASMIATQPSLLPMAELLPEWLSAFPVRIDQIESGFAYGTLISLLEHSSQDIFPHIPTAFKILIDAIGSPVITEETRARVHATIKSLWAQFSNDLQPVLETLDEEGSNNLQAALSS